MLPEHFDGTSMRRRKPVDQLQRGEGETEIRPTCACSIIVRAKPSEAAALLLLVVILPKSGERHRD